MQIKHSHPSRRTVLEGLTATSGAALLGSSMLSNAAWAQSAVDPRVAKIVADTISVDMHNHDGQPMFAKTPADARPDPVGVDLRGQMNKAGLSAICLTYAVDGYRTPQKGEWYQFHLQCLAHDDRLLAQNGMRRALTAADLKTAHANKMPIVIQDCEGAQWIEGRLERVEEVYKRGLRHMQLLHQIPDMVEPLGAVQQYTPLPGGPAAQAVTGLTAFGAQVIRECNRLGIVVDMAHANEETVMGALKVAQQPLVVTHTAFDSEVARSSSMYTGNPGLTARLVGKNYAKAVADFGGVVGIWHIFPTLKDYVTGIKQLVDVIGVDHVGIGTDTSVAPAPRAAPPPPPANAPAAANAGPAAASGGGRGGGGAAGGTNESWPDETGGFLYALAQEMLAQGFIPNEISKIAGGNYVRLFGTVTRSAT